MLVTLLEAESVCSWNLWSEFVKACFQIMNQFTTASAESTTQKLPCNQTGYKPITRVHSMCTHDAPKVGLLSTQQPQLKVKTIHAHCNTSIVFLLSILNLQLPCHTRLKRRCGIKKSDHRKAHIDCFVQVGAAESGNGSERSLVVEECSNLSCTSGCKFTEMLTW